MKIYTSILILSLALVFTGCNKFLDRPPLTVANDETAWDTEENLRLYANKYYPSFFPGYGLAFNYSGAALMGYQFSDDVFVRGNQSNFTRAVPSSGIWSYSLIRSMNIMINRIEDKMKDVLEEEAYNHWLGVGRFFRGFQYSDMVTAYGDIPYYNYVPSDVNLDDLYKERTPRNTVMDAVYDDLKFAMENTRSTDEPNSMNKYIIAGFVSRIALREASWQKYYYKNSAQAKKFFELALEAGELVISSGRYGIETEFRELFTSENLGGNRDVLLYRHYDASVGIQHAIASNNNFEESVAIGPTTALIKSFICTDGKPWQNSGVSGASDFSLSALVKTRDPRLEATFYDKPSIMNKASLWYINKFLPRSVVEKYENGEQIPTEFTSSNNTTDYPVLRYAEVLLNWIEAKAELETSGGEQVSQDDLDRSVNAIRNRPLAQQAIDKGVEKTAPLQLSSLPADPNRDSDVSALIWEIRRERRMEFAFEYGRYEDLKRWHKLDHMDTDEYPDLLSGGWVNFPTELPEELESRNQGEYQVVDMDGNITTYEGNNDGAMRGFFRTETTGGRLPFLDLPNVNPYLSPVGKNQMNDYESMGYHLEQTEGWPDNF